MENIQPAARISELPQHIKEHVVSLLPQEDAVRTCLLSKSWRYLGPTRPKIEFDESSYPEISKKQFLSVVENTLQRYDDRKLLVQEFVLSMLWPENRYRPINSNSLLNKWIVKLQMLKRLSLHLVCIKEETFEKIMSSCPLIQHLVLDSCDGLSTIKVNKARNLKHLDCGFVNQKDTIEINDDAPSLETIHIKYCKNWYLKKKHYFFPRLKSLKLWNVHLPTEKSFINLSSKNCPCLEELEIRHCYGFTEEFKLSNRSIKRLIIKISHHHPIKAANIDVANILYFKFVSSYLPSIFSFATTSSRWKSRIRVWYNADSNADTWPLKLNEFLRALRQSQISLHISYDINWTNQDTYDGGSCEPVVVEHLCLKEYCPSYEVPVLLNCQFRIFCPRYIGLSLYSTSQKIHERKLAESIWKTLVKKGETGQCDYWQQDLEESSIQVWDKNANEWRPVQVYEFSNNEKIRFRLTWRDFS